MSLAKKIERRAKAGRIALAAAGRQVLREGSLSVQIVNFALRAQAAEERWLKAWAIKGARFRRSALVGYSLRRRSSRPLPAGWAGAWVSEAGAAA